MNNKIVSPAEAAAIVRSTSVIALSTVVAHRVLPLLRTGVRAGGARAPHYR